MTVLSPGDIANFINATVPSLIGGAFSIAGVVVLFWLQQRSQRKAEKESRRIEAVEHLMKTLDDARLTFRSGQRNADQLSLMYTNSWRFAWLLDKDERPVADWAWAVLHAALREAPSLPTTFDRDKELAGVIIQVMDGLNKWRTGERKVSWYAAEANKLEESEETSNS